MFESNAAAEILNEDEYQSDFPQISLPAFKLTVERTVFLRALAHMQSVADKRSTTEILANVKLEAAGETLTLSATDLEIAISETIPAIVDQEGSLTVPAHTLYEIVRKIPDACQIVLETSELRKGQVSLIADLSLFFLGALPAEDFPIVSAGEASHRFTIDSDDLKYLLGKTHFAMSSEESRYYLNGVHIHTKDDQEDAPILRAVATDGHRLAMVDVAMPEDAAGMPGIIIPRKAVQEIRRLIENANAPIEIALSDAKISLQFAGATFLSKLVDATYPEYERVVPYDNSNIMEVSVDRLKHAIDRVSTVTEEKSRLLKFTIETGVLTITSVGDERDSAKETLDIGYNGPVLMAAFNSRYLLDMLNCFEGNTANFAFSSGNAPSLVRDPAEPRSIFVIMPLKI
jgi:DNA polymerase-3 subunit beta